MLKQTKSLQTFNHFFYSINASIVFTNKLKLLENFNERQILAEHDTLVCEMNAEFQVKSNSVSTVPWQIHLKEHTDI